VALARDHRARPLKGVQRVRSPPPAEVPPTSPRASPAVSVIVPIFNAERFLDEAIQSVIGQTWQNWELLLVDDGCTDASSTIARRYAASDPDRIRCLEHPGHRNLGLPASRNLAIQHARGEYLAPLDADDLWLPEKLEQQIAILEAHPEVALLFGAPLYWHGWSGRPEDRAQDHVIDLKLPANRVYDPPTLLVPLLRGEAPWLCPCDVLMRREAVISVGGFDFPGQVYEDSAFFSKMLLHFPAFMSSRTWDWYRQRPDSMWAAAKATGTHRLAREHYLKWFRRYLRRQKLTSGPVWEAVLARLQPSQLRSRLVGRARREARRALDQGRRVARIVLPPPIHWWIRTRVLRRDGASPPPGAIRFGSFRRLTPMSRRFGWDRGGLPVDRYYIEDFLTRHAGDIRGHVLEVRDSAYTRRFGGDRVTRVDVLHPTSDNANATIVADLTCAEQVPSDTFDCIVLTQVLPFIPDVPAAVRTLHRILRPGGVVLATVPGISHIIRYDMDRWGDYWRFTSLSARRLFEHAFPNGEVEVEAHGNVLAATGFLHGLASKELRPEELDQHDRDYEVLIAIRAVKRSRRAAELERGPVSAADGAAKPTVFPVASAGETARNATGANLILALADGMTAPQLEPFLRSTLILAERPEIMFFCGNLDAETVALLDHYRVRIAPFRSLWEGTRRRRNLAFTTAIRGAMAAARLTTALFAPRGPRRPIEVQRQMIGPLLPPLHARFFACLDAIEALYPRVERVFLTDVRDVVFQADPFTFTEDKLWVFEEDIRAGMQFTELNRTWYLETFGRRAWRQIEHFPAICAGTVLGSREAVVRYLRVLTAVMVARPPVVGGDQAIHNFVCRFGHVPAEIVPNETGAVLTLQSIADAELRYDDEGRVLNAAGKPYPILHMYDRVPQLRDRVLERLGVDPTLFEAGAHGPPDLRTHW
jgi:glycosyltransferase involved in cell wall biosynthesis